MDPTQDPTLVDEASGERGAVAPVALGEISARERSPGDVLDRRYRLRSRLGRGGFGDVWRAEELLPDGAPFREVALKLLLPDFTDAAHWAKEAKLLASFRHPSLVTVYAAGILQEPPHAPFVAMELLEGCTLGELLRQRGPVPWRRVLAWAREAAAALDVMHARGVVHLDLKPANLFLGRDGALKVLDFGISRQAGAQPARAGRGRAGGAPVSADAGSGAAAAPGGSLLLEVDDEAPTGVLAAGPTAFAATRPAEALSSFAGGRTVRGVVGTPGFIAPEVIELGDPSAATDAYALAVCVVQLATGRLPHQAPDEPQSWADASSVSTWWLKIRAATLEGSMRDLAADPARLPAGLVALLTRLLAVDPAARGVEAGGLRALLDEAWERPHGVPDPPYFGLSPLPAQAEGLLFGRDDDIARLGRELEFEPCVVLQGARGVGKTSLACAGLAPYLARRQVDQKDDWAAVVVQPGDDPDGALAAALGALAPELAGASFEQLAAWCERSPVGLALVVDPLDDLAPAQEGAAAEPPRSQLGGPLSLGRAPALPPVLSGEGARVSGEGARVSGEGARVSGGADLEWEDSARDTLLDLRASMGGPGVAPGRLAEVCARLGAGERRPGIRVIGVLGEDRAAALLGTPLGERMRGALRYVGPPGAAAVKEIVAGPARLAGAEVTGLEQVAAEVQREIRSGGAALPFVGLALAAWWGARTRKDGRVILRGEAWRELGGVRGAMARHADHMLSALAPPLRDLAGEMLLRLGAVDESPLRWSEEELIDAVASTPAEAATAAEVLAALERAQLLRRRGGTVEVAHAALLSSWPNLRRLRSLHVQRLVLLERLREAAERWEGSGYHSDFLLRGEVLKDLPARGLPRRERDLVRESRKRARWRLVRRLGLGALAASGLAGALATEQVMVERQAEADLARRAAEERADLAEVIGRSRRAEDPFHRVAWAAEAMARGATDATLPLDLASAAAWLPRAQFLTLEPVTAPALPWDDRWVIGGAPRGALFVADLRPLEAELVEHVELDADPDEVAAARFKAPSALTLRVHEAPIAERVPLAFDTAVVTRAVSGEVRVTRLREDGTAALAATAPVRCSGPLRAAEAAPVVACSTEEGMARWDLRRGAGALSVDRHGFRGVVLDVSPDGARVAAALGRRVLLWEPRPAAAYVGAAAGPPAPREVELTLAAPAVLGRWSPRDAVIALVEPGRIAVHAFASGATPPPPLIEIATTQAPASGRWDAGGLDFGLCSANGAGRWYYLRKGGRAAADPPPQGSPCAPPSGARRAEPLRSDRDAPELAELELGPHPLAGGFRLPDGRVLSRDLVLFTPGGPGAARLLRFEARDENGLAPEEESGASAAAVLRDEDVVAWQIGGEVRLHDTRGRPIIAREGRLIRRCDDGRLAAYRVDARAGAWRLFNATTDAVFAAVPRAPGFLLGLDAACRTLFTQQLDGSLWATPLDGAGGPRQLAAADGYVYEARPSPAREGAGSGLLLALSSGAVARIDDATQEVRVLAYATPWATAIGDGPEPGDVAYADSTGVLLVRRGGASERVLDGAAFAAWEDLAVAPDGRTMLLASAERIAALDLTRRELLGSMHAEGFERLAPWDEEGSVLAWSFDRSGGAEGLVVPRGLGLSRRVALAVSNLGVDRKQLLAR